MPTAFAANFVSRKHRLEPGGEFAFDAISEDGQTIALITTSRAKTSGGKGGVGKQMKMRADALFLTMAVCTRRMMIFADPGMHQWCHDEQARGRLPRAIEFHHVELPLEMAQALALSQEKASCEVRPSAPK